MAASFSDDPFSQLPSLSLQQQELLLAALSSNRRNENQRFLPASMPKTTGAGAEGIDPSVFAASQDALRSSMSGQPPTFRDSLFPDLNESGTTFDVDFYSGDDLSDMFPKLASDPGADGDVHEKRKSPEDESDDEEGDSKRRDGDDKSAKKAGRKPLVSEPTTKRKAQNRAAQRAFRERKEKHLKDLEQKVMDLEKSSESTVQENLLLKAQLDRVQTELQEYRKRLSVSGGGLSISPPASSLPSFQPKGRNSSLGETDFKFDFNKFGDLSSSNGTFSNPAKLPTPGSSRSNSGSKGESVSPSTNGSHAFSVRPSGSSFPLASASREFSTTRTSSIPTSSIFDFPRFGSPAAMPNAMSIVKETSSSQGRKSMSRSGSDLASPSMSSVSRNGASSSCGTSPEPSAYMNGQDSQQTTMSNKTFESLANDQEPSLDAYNPTSFDFSNSDWLSSQNGGQFDPVLFGDYRESQDAIIGGGDFSGGFFEDPLIMGDFDVNNFDFPAAQMPVSPPSSSSSKLMQQVARHRDGAEDDGPISAGEQQKGSEEDEPSKKGEIMKCHEIWNELRACPKFQAGELDIDSLCSDLSKKATCSETGLTVPKEVYQAALWKLVGKPDMAPPVPSPFYFSKIDNKSSRV